MKEFGGSNRRERMLTWGEPPVDTQSIDQATFQLPVGTVTFMLTDIEGSTRLWEHAPDAMGKAVARHYSLLDAGIALHGGVRPLEQGEGDSVVAAFTRASDAVAAAFEAQRALSNETWPEGVLLKVRIALHTAEAQLRDEGNYFGQAVNRAARLRAVAHGGQIVLSGTTRDLVLDRLPEGVELEDLGTHRLRDLARPEHVFGLRHADLPGEFPPLRSLDALPNNLPSELTNFVGRGPEQAKVGELVERVRFLTLIGAGGCGKTRLALQAAADRVDHHPDGVWWVELARLEDPELLPTVVMEAIGVKEVPGRTPLETLVEHFRERQALLVLDNCEHLLAPCADLTERLLRACPSLTILATSRAPLGVPGETAWRVPSMSLPTERSPEMIEALRTSDAVRLFLDRALQVRPNFEITHQNAPIVAQICHDLDGIPLAIELAAARVRMMAPEQIARGLGDRFHLLTGGGRTVMPRHQTLEASIDWSHALLSEGERVLLRRMSVFTGGWTLDTAEEVCAGGPIDRYAVLDLLTGLVDKSLITTDERASEVRYGFLETVRQYAAKRLANAGELSEVRARHLAYYGALVEAAEPHLLGAGRDDAVMHTLVSELPNLRSALEWAAVNDPMAGLRIVAALSAFWLFTGRFHEGDAAFVRALDSAPEQPSPVRGLALAGRAHLAQHGGSYEAAHRWAQAALEVGERCSDARTQARALNILGRGAAFGDPIKGRQLLERSSELATAAGDDWCRVSAMQTLAIAWNFQDEFETARPILDDSFKAATTLGYRRGIALYWWCRGWEAVVRGRFEEASKLLELSVAASDEVGDPFPNTMANGFISYLLVACGDFERARSLATKNLERVRRAGVGIVLGVANQMLGRAEMSLGRLDEARRHLESAVNADRAFPFLLSWHLAALGTLNRIEGKLDEARSCGEEALEFARHGGNRWMQAGAEILLGRVALAEGDSNDAERYIHDALIGLSRKDIALHRPECLDVLAAVASSQESFDEAARLLGAAAAGRGDLRIGRVPPEAEFWGDVEHVVQEALGSDAYDEEFGRGSGMGMEEAVAYARRARGERKRPSRGWASLTPTELRVVHLVAVGLTNPQIGERLFISRGTVKAHLSHIFSKLHISSRSQLAAEATRHGLDHFSDADVG